VIYFNYRNNMNVADKIAEELGWQKEVDYPSWGHAEVYLKTISK